MKLEEKYDIVRERLLLKGYSEGKVESIIKKIRELHGFIIFYKENSDASRSIDMAFIHVLEEHKIDAHSLLFGLVDETIFSDDAVYQKEKKYILSILDTINMVNALGEKYPSAPDRRAK